MVLKKMALRRVLGSQRQEATEGLTKVQNEEFHDFVFITKCKKGYQMKDEIGMICSMHQRTRNAYKLLVRKPRGKR